MLLYTFIKRFIYIVKRFLGKNDVLIQKTEVEAKERTVIHINIITQIQYQEKKKTGKGNNGAENKSKPAKNNS